MMGITIIHVWKDHWSIILPPNLVIFFYRKMQEKCDRRITNNKPKAPKKKSGGKKRKTTFLKWVSLIKAGSMRITVKNAPKGKWN